MDETKVRHTTWKHSCGWYRTRNLDAGHARAIIQHPIHGDVTSMEAALMDIEQHDCNAYREALRRLHGDDDAGKAQTVRKNERKSQVRARDDDERWFSADDASGGKQEVGEHDSRPAPARKARPDGRSRGKKST